MFSAAALNPEYYSTDIAMNWLRSVFVDALKVPIKEHKAGHKLLLVYWMCMLWAGAMHSMNAEKRVAEAIALLRKLESEIDKYLAHFKFSSFASDIMAVCVANLKISAHGTERKRLDKKIHSLSSFGNVTIS